MKIQMSKVLCIAQGIFFALIIFYFILHIRGNILYSGHEKMCLDMYDELFEDPGDNFLEECKDQFSKYMSFKDWEVTMNSWLGGYGWSHFSVYRPYKTKELWSSITKETGAKFKFIENSWIVMKPHPESPFKRGDHILSVNKNKKLNYQLLSQTEGLFQIERKNKKIDVQVKLRDYKWDDKIKLIKPNILKVPSFRKEFFEEEKFVGLLEEINSDEVILDLRGNYGGNMGAGLTFLSYFFCKPVTVGYIERPRSELEEADFPNTLDDLSQMKKLEKYKKLNLTTFKKDYCVDKKIKVVVNSGTSSTAELVAQAFVDLERGELIGQPTSGQLVLSKWNDVLEFPEGYSYSYPVAIYKTIYDVMIEGYGVYPDVIKNHDLTYEKQGLDSFLID